MAESPLLQRQPQLLIYVPGGMEAMASTIPNTATGSKATSLHHAFIRTLLLSQSSAGYVSLCRVIASATPPDYTKISAPVLILAGDEDKSAPLEGCRDIFKSIGSEKKSMNVYKGVGHWIVIESPEEVATSMIEFCRSMH